MKSIRWLTLMRFRMLSALVIGLSAAVLWSCSEPADVSPRAENAPGQLKKLGATGSENEISSNSNSTADPDDYSIKVTKSGTTWTYVICGKPGAKGISHFILDLENCPRNQTLNFNSIVSATVNGQPATLSSSEGNTGCNVSEVTTNFVKFDDLAEADTYTIVFTLDKEYGNVLETTAWIKAGTSCFAYVVDGPCCA